MAILTTKSIQAIDTAAISKGDLVRIQYRSWETPINGIVASVSNEAIRVLYIGTGGNVTNYIVIRADDLAAGDWTVLWSTDLETVNTNAEGGTEE